MTVIACRAGVIAADRLISNSNELIVGYRTKCYSINGVLFGTCGASQDVSAFKKWIEDGRSEVKPNVDEHFLALLIEPDGRVVHYNGKLFGFSIDGDYFAIGSGDEVAMGAMWMGASAEQAVQAACALVLGCGGGVDVVRLPALPPAGETPPTAPRNQSSDLTS